MEDLEELFEECSNSIHHIVPEDTLKKYANNKLENIEAVYTGALTAHTDRLKEKADLISKIKKAEYKLKECKNPTNTAKMPYSKREALTKQLSQYRVNIRNEIARYKVRLNEIEMEENEKPHTEDKSSKKEGEIKNNWKMNQYDEYNDF